MKSQSTTTSNTNGGFREPRGKIKARNKQARRSRRINRRK